MRRYLIAALAAIALAGCNAEAFNAPPDFEFVCMRDGVESLRLRASYARMEYDQRAQIEHWTLAVASDTESDGQGSYRHESGLHEVCGPQLQPPDPNVD